MDIWITTAAPEARRTSRSAFPVVWLFFTVAHTCPTQAVAKPTQAITLASIQARAAGLAHNFPPADESEPDDSSFAPPPDNQTNPPALGGGSGFSALPGRRDDGPARRDEGRRDERREDAPSRREEGRREERRDDGPGRRDEGRRDELRRDDGLPHHHTFGGGGGFTERGAPSAFPPRPIGPITMVVAPLDPAQRELIDRLAMFVAEEGHAFEQVYSTLGN